MSKDWRQAKDLQLRADSLVKLMDQRKGEIWNFVTVNKELDSDKVIIIFFPEEWTVELKSNRNSALEQLQR